MGLSLGLVWKFGGREREILKNVLFGGSRAAFIISRTFARGRYGRACLARVLLSASNNNTDICMPQNVSKPAESEAQAVVR